MAYAAQSDIAPNRMTQQELIQLTCDDSSQVVNADIVAEKIAEAGGIVDSYCRARYGTPLATSQVVLKVTVDIAVYLLFSRRRGGLQPTELVRQNYEDALAFLKDVATAKASLDQPAGDTPQISSAGPQISERDRRLTFRESEIEGYV